MRVSKFDRRILSPLAALGCVVISYKMLLADFHTDIIGDILMKGSLLCILIVYICEKALVMLTNQDKQ